MVLDVWDTQVHCAVRAGDKADNWSRVSSLVSSLLPPRPTSTSPLPETSQHLETADLLELIRRGHIHNISSIHNIQVGIHIIFDEALSLILTSRVYRIY